MVEQSSSGTEQIKTVEVGGATVPVQSDDTVADLLRYASGSLGASPETTVLLRDADCDGSYPDPDDVVPHDLSTLEDGDTVIAYRLRESHRPAYGRYVGTDTDRSEVDA